MPGMLLFGIPQADLPRLRDELASAGKRVVLTNGFFDLGRSSIRIFGEPVAYSGGILLETGGPAQITDTVVRDNHSDSGGGGIESGRLPQRSLVGVMLLVVLGPRDFDLGRAAFLRTSRE